MLAPTAQPLYNGPDPTPVETVYFGTDEGYPYAVSIAWNGNQAGASLKWVYQVMDDPPGGGDPVAWPIRSTPCLVQFNTEDPSWGVCFGADNGQVYCLRDDGDHATLKWRSTRIGAVHQDTYPVVRSGPLFRHGLFQVPGEQGDRLAVVFVGAVVPNVLPNHPPTGRLVAIDVDWAEARDATFVSGYDLSFDFGVAGSVSYFPKLNQYNEIERGVLFVTDMAGNLRAWNEYGTGFEDALTYGPPPNPNQYYPPCMGWASLTSEDDDGLVVIAYYGTATNPGYGGYIYAANARVRWNFGGLLDLDARWTDENENPNERIKTVPWRPPGFPPPPVQNVRLGWIFGDPCVSRGGHAYLPTWETEPNHPWGMFLRVDDYGDYGRAFLVHKHTTAPKDLRATPCIAPNHGTADIIFFATASGYLYAVAPSGAIASGYPVNLGATVGHSSDPLGARPHVAVDHQGIVYIGNNDGVLKAIWAPHE